MRLIVCPAGHLLNAGEVIWYHANEMEILLCPCDRPGRAGRPGRVGQWWWGDVLAMEE